VIYSNLGLLFKSTHVDSTLHYFKKSKIQFESFELPENISKHHFNIEQSVFNSFVDIHEKKYTKAIKNLKTCIDILKLKANDKNDRDVLVAAYEYLILAYEKTDQLKKANACLKEKEKFMVQFHQEELKIEIAKIETAFETKEKEEHIRKLELKNRAKDLEVTQKQTQLVAGSLIALAILLLALIFFRQRIFKNRFEKISLEQRLLRSQMNPHFIYNVLQNAISLIDKQPKEAKGFIANFGQLLRLNLENSREDFVFLEDELKALKGYLELSSALTKKFFHTIAVDPDIDPAATKIPPMLIQPLVENAIKHGINGIAEEGKIKVSLSKKTKTLLHCNICDNGKGFSPMQGKPSNQHRSLSLNILQERLHMYVKNKKNAMVTIEHPNAKGKNMSCVGINIPFQEI
ncbi:MAG: histidine kinase, partial [Bacteroidota bacterium]